MLLPTSVWLPVTLYVAPSPFAKPSPLTVTSPFVSAVPSYSLLSEAEVSVTSRLLIVKLPSVTTNVTFVKLLLVFVNWLSVSPILYSPALVPSAFLSPLNVKSSVVYSGLLMLVTV